MKNTGQLEHTSDAHWVMAIAQALGTIKDLADRQDAMVARNTEIMLEEQKRLAEMINTSIADNENYPAHNSNADRIAQYNRMMAEDRQNIETHAALRDAYRAAAAILEAATGEYHYAARRGYYRTDIKKFQTAEARDAFLQGKEGWREATEDDLQKIFWGEVIPEAEG